MKPKILISRRWPKAVEARLSVRYDVTLNEGDTPLTLDQLQFTGADVAQLGVGVFAVQPAQREAVRQTLMDSGAADGGQE